MSPLGATALRMVLVLHDERQGVLGRMKAWLEVTNALMTARFKERCLVLGVGIIETVF